MDFGHLNSLTNKKPHDTNFLVFYWKYVIVSDQTYGIAQDLCAYIFIEYEPAHEILPNATFM